MPPGLLLARATRSAHRCCCAAAGDTDARAVGTQWMLGESLLVSPVVLPGVASVQAYIPPGVWYSAWDYSSVTGGACHMACHSAA